MCSKLVASKGAKSDCLMKYCSKLLQEVLVCAYGHTPVYGEHFRFLISKSYFSSHLFVNEYSSVELA